MNELPRSAGSAGQHNRDLRCIQCGESDLVDAVPEQDTVRGALQCRQCGVSYDRVFGVPCLCAFTESDFLGLIEIVAGLRARAFHDGARWILKQEEDQGVAIDNIDALFAEPWRLYGPDAAGGTPGILPPRLAMYHAALRAWGKLNFKGSRVLDVGAGTGFDSQYYLRAGGEVTALEYSPVLAGVGRQACPDIRWICGGGHALPFADESFDIVVANATLHHMSDIPEALSEMLRVLKLGGRLVTISDSFCPDSYTEKDEARILNRHPDVMSGVNEQLVRPGPLLDTLAAQADALKVEVLTDVVYGRAPQPMVWSLAAARKTLPIASGSMNLRVTKLGPTTHSFKPAKPALSLADLFAQATDPAGVLASLSDLSPISFRNLDVLSPIHPKLRLLTGWALPDGNADSREAYGHAHLFLSADRLRGRTVSFHILAPWIAERDDAVLDISVDGSVLHTQPIQRGIWTTCRVVIPDDRVRDDGTHILSIRLGSNSRSADARWMRIAPLDAVKPPSGLEAYGVSTLFAGTYPGIDNAVVLSGGEFALDVETLSRLSTWQRQITLVVSADQRVAWDWAETGGIGAVTTELPKDAGLILATARDYIHAGEVISHHGLSEGDHRIHIVLPGGHARLASDSARLRRTGTSSLNLKQRTKRWLLRHVGPERIEQIRKLLGYRQ